MQPFLIEISGQPFLGGERTIIDGTKSYINNKLDGSVERYKARLVAKGLTQTYGIDYQETFAPIAKINPICVLLSFTIHFN